jgi:hypothetical protein
MQQQETNWPSAGTQGYSALDSNPNYYISAETEDSELEDATG